MRRKVSKQTKTKRRKARIAKLKAFWNKVGTLNVILVVVFILFLRFNAQMIEIYKLQGSIPETYAITVVGALIGECGICGWIRTTKDKRKHKEEEPEEIDWEEGGKG